MFSPKEELPHEEFQSIEDINNFLLEHKEGSGLISKTAGKGKSAFLMFDGRTENWPGNWGWVCFPSDRTSWTTR